MAFARDVYTATGGQTDFTISYNYLSQTHVEVYQNGTQLVESTDFTYSNATTVALNSGATAGDTIVLVRNSSQGTPLVDFTAGVLIEGDLDTANLQAIYMAQEAIDSVGQNLGKDSNEIWDAAGIRIQNLGTPENAADAVTKAYVDAISAAAGNVPTPGTPGEDGYLLTASGGSWSWADLPDNSVTLAKMEDGTAGDVLYYGASGAPTRLSAGTSGQSLVMGASYPEWGTGIPTGSVTQYLGTTAPSGWLLLNGDTTGSASSGSTNASADNEALFTLLFDSFADAESAIFTSAGAGTTRAAQTDAATAWAANCRITLPDATGRAIFGKEASATRLTSGGAGVDGATMGDSGGAQTHQLTEAELASHTHTWGSYGYFSPNAGPSDYTDAYNANSFNSGATGGDTAHTNLPPALILSMIVKV